MTVTIATRQYQLVPLTHEQVDTNFINLADAVNVNGASISALGQDGGSALIGNGGETVADSFNALQLADYTALRAYVGPRKSVYVIGYLGTAAPSGVAGMFVRDDHDTTTADNGGTVIVTSGGVRWKRQDSGAVNVMWFGAKGDGVTDDTAAIQSALFNCAGLAYGATLYFPRARYLTSATLTLAANVNLKGDSRLASQIDYTGTGDGLKYGGTVNSYTNLRVSISDLAIFTTNVANAGGGIVLESCAYVELHNFYVEGFKYGHILDQVIHFRCNYSEITKTTRAGIWIVNGPDRRIGAGVGFTNNIWYGTEVQINPTQTADYYCLQDDGGGNHIFTGINFNNGDVQARFAGVTCLYLGNCDFEGALQTPITLTDTTRETGAYVGPVNAFTFENFSATCSTAFEINLDAAENGRIENGIFASYSAAVFNFTSNKVANVRIINNNKLVTGPARCALPFFNSSLTAALIAQNDTDGQPAVTYVSAALGATGVQAVTPAIMENITVGRYLWVQNADGTNGEQVLVSAVSTTQFTATFASTKAANWIIQGQSKNATEGTWTPTIIGTSTAGAQTYTTQYGYWKKQGNKVHVTGTVTISAKDAGIAGSVAIGGLPFVAMNVPNQFGNANFGYWSGLTFPANFTQLAALISPNDTKLSLRRMGSGQSGAPVAVSELGASATFIFDATYYVS